MFTIGKSFTFAAAHHLPKLPEGHKCRRVHGHNYVVTVYLSSSTVDRRGFVVDYGDLEPFGEFIKSTLDHQDLNAVLSITPTAELLAKYLYEQATDRLTGRVIGVRVSETPNTFAEYRP